MDKNEISPEKNNEIPPGLTKFAKITYISLKTFYYCPKNLPIILNLGFWHYVSQLIFEQLEPETNSEVGFGNKS